MTVLCLDRILHIHSPKDTHITGREGVSALILAHHTLNEVSGFNAVIRRGCGQLAGDLRMLPHGVMGGTVTQGCAAEVCIRHPSSPFTLQKQKKKKMGIGADKLPPWDWLWAAAATGIVTTILASRPGRWNALFLSQEETGDPAN